MAFSRKSLGVNILLVLGLCALLYILFFSSLGWITRHGAEVNVPKYIGRDIRTAVSELKKAGFQVSIDSSYEPDRRPLIVLAQQPEVGAVVKRGRTLFLTINKAEPPKTAMPALVNLSFRSATLILKSNRLVLGDTTRRPDIAEGAVLEQRYLGKIITAGTAVPQGARIDLVIGAGLGMTPETVPDVIGMAPDEAEAFLAGNGLQPILVWPTEPIADSSLVVVYNQDPPPFNDLGAPSRIREGDMVTIMMKESPTVEEMERNRNPRLTVDDGDDGSPARPVPPRAGN